MGVNISRLVSFKETKLEELSGKRIAIDTYIHLHQFLKTMPVLTDAKGRLTTHLSGLFYRTIHLMEMGIKPVFVFDGPFLLPGQKPANIEPRTSSTITPEIVGSAKRLIELLGLPIVQAYADGEAQAAYMAKEGDVWAAASQDYDALLFGAPVLLINLTMARKRKLPTGGYVMIGTYIVKLKELLCELGIDRRQLVALAMLVGTDYNPGIYGIGQKRALSLVKKYGNDFERMFEDVGWDYEYRWKEVFDHILNMPVNKRYHIKWRDIDEEGVLHFLVEEHSFNKERVKKALRRAGLD